MTLMAVDLDKNGKPTKWMVENSWGPAAGYQGYLIMTDDWFNEIYVPSSSRNEICIEKSSRGVETEAYPTSCLGSYVC